MITSPYQKYQQTQAQTASKPKLLIMLYDGAIRFVNVGIEGVEERNIEKANNNFCKAQAIINELIASLNFNYSISTELLSIYEYLLNRLVEANIKKNKDIAMEVLEHLSELREAWLEAAKSPGMTAEG
ncbi:flagellar export chaperone FliS [Paenibacillus sp. JNUCC31]|uniref:flagellar export chaperone FliS n=1 Tax=Paenibacillus sp. JNUCC-31 TaxID=2777983 RepID=UPI00178687E1|nr:flagellar export chaperone FliS [Paenibacillus sp. JNUCC-31]QOS81405.1 flagellar export chaperone FliS [Paenibacillus sp. JNUCC-31]